MALLGVALSRSPDFNRLKPGLQRKTLPVVGLHPSQSRRFRQLAREQSEFLNCLRRVTFRHRRTSSLLQVNHFAAIANFEINSTLTKLQTDFHE